MNIIFCSVSACQQSLVNFVPCDKCIYQLDGAYLQCALYGDAVSVNYCGADQKHLAFPFEER